MQPIYLRLLRFDRLNALPCTTTWIVVLMAIVANLLLPSVATALPQSELTVNIDGLKNTQGQVCLSIFASGQGFPDRSDRAVAARCVRVTNTSLTITFPGVMAGTYAVAVIHDTNNNGRIDRNALGIPTEGFGFSQNPRILTGPPRFGDSQIVVAGPKTDIEIQLQYLL
jgi:uncharacterized protein (DUF2141 family)